MHPNPAPHDTAGLRQWRRCMPRTLLLAACLSLLLASSIGCGSYPEVTSAESLELIRIVYTATNTQNPTRLAAARARYEELDKQHALSEQESARFDAILDLADAGQWEQASAMAMDYAQAQVR
jgi:hypothetical protein